MSRHDVSTGYQTLQNRGSLFKMKYLKREQSGHDKSSRQQSTSFLNPTKTHALLSYAQHKTGSGSHIAL